MLLLRLLLCDRFVHLLHLADVRRLLGGLLVQRDESRVGVRGPTTLRGASILVLQAHLLLGRHGDSLNRLHEARSRTALCIGVAAGLVVLGHAGEPLSGGRLRLRVLD